MNAAKCDITIITIHENDDYTYWIYTPIFFQNGLQPIGQRRHVICAPNYVRISDFVSEKINGVL